VETYVCATFLHRTVLVHPETCLPLLFPYLTWSWYQKECYDSRDLWAQCHLGFPCGCPIKLRIPYIVYPGCYGAVPMMGVIWRQRGHCCLWTYTRRNNESRRKAPYWSSKCSVRLTNWHCASTSELNTYLDCSLCLERCASACVKRFYYLFCMGKNIVTSSWKHRALEKFKLNENGINKQFRIVLTEELRNLYGSPSVQKIMESRRLRWARHVARNKFISYFGKENFWKMFTWKTVGVEG